MKGTKLVELSILVFLMSLAFGCTPEMPATLAPSVTPALQPTQATKAPSVTPTLQSTQTTKAPSGSEWQQDWERVKAEAKKEGTVLIYASAGPTVREGFNKAFNDDFGIGTEWVTGVSGEVAQKVLTEQRSGLYAGDIWINGANPTLPLLRPAGAIVTLDPLLLLPEVIDKKAWYGGELIWAEPGPQHYWVGLLCFPQPPLVVNTDLVKPGEITGYRDLLAPKWKGKIALYDPTKAGAGASWFTAVVTGIMDMDYVRELIKQEPVIVGDARQHLEWVARGKYPIALAGRTEQQLEFKNSGAPIQIISPVEGVHLTASAGGVAVLKKAPHPNAAKLFLNWVLTKKGGTLASKLIGGQSARVDVPTDFLDPAMVRKPSQKYHNTISEEYEFKKQEMQKVAAQMFAPLLK